MAQCVGKEMKLEMLRKEIVQSKNDEAKLISG